jgi:hypothetical protein
MPHKVTSRRFPPPWSVEELTPILSCATTTARTSLMSISRMGDGQRPRLFSALFVRRGRRLLDRAASRAIVMRLLSSARTFFLIARVYSLRNFAL